MFVVAASAADGDRVDPAPGSCLAAILPSVLAGELAEARELAVDYAVEALTLATTTAVLPWATSAATETSLHAVRAKECADAWTVATGKLLREPDHLSLVRTAHMDHAVPVASAPSAEGCVLERGEWDRCCSGLRGRAHPPAADCFRHRGRLGDEACCIFGNGNGSRAFLRIPALREVHVRVQLVSERLLVLTQDGFLRPFDVPSVLWPAGYLLAQWASSACEALRGLRVIELGAGVGAASIAAALCGTAQLVLATDRAPHSLALVAANAALNGADVTVRRVDWEDHEALRRAVAEHGPFDLVLGAALHFETWHASLWGVLEQLLPHGRGRVALAHTQGSIATPDPWGRFAEAERLPGTTFGMHTAHSEETSDFEVVLVDQISGAHCNEVTTK